MALEVLGVSALRVLQIGPTVPQAKRLPFPVETTDNAQAPQLNVSGKALIETVKHVNRKIIYYVTLTKTKPASIELYIISEYTRVGPI